MKAKVKLLDKPMSKRDKMQAISDVWTMCDIARWNILEKVRREVDKDNNPRAQKALIEVNSHLNDAAVYCNLALRNLKRKAKKQK